MNSDVIIKCKNCSARNKVSIEKIFNHPVCGKCRSRLSVPDRPLSVSELDFNEEVLAETIPTAVDFWAPWCGPCQMVGPILEEIAGKYPGRIKVVKINSDENPNLSFKYGIQGIPTIILFRDGREVDRVVGAVPRENILHFLRL